MKTNLIKSFFTSSILCFALNIESRAQQTPTALDNYIIQEMKDHNMPGVAVAIVKDGKLALAKGYGFADIDKDIPYTPNTIQGVASISKAVTATAIMKLWEEGLFQLDDPINSHLPFSVTNPYYPGTPLTFHMLLNHTSSVNFGRVLMDGLFEQPFVAPGTAPSLGTFLQSYFDPSGSLYVDSISYHNWQPGTQYEYSNFGYALLGYLVETISGMPFNEYCNLNIFQPLGMSNTAWYYSELDTNIVSRPYQLKAGSKGQAQDYGLYEWTDYPGGQLKSSVIDLARFFLMHMNNGKLGDVRIIDSATEVMMRTAQITIVSNASIEHDHEPFYFDQEECLGLQRITQLSNDDEVIFGKSGGAMGVNAQAWFNPSDNKVMCNVDNISNYDEQAFATAEINIHLDVVVSDTISTSSAPVLDRDYQYNPCEHSINYWKNNTDEWPLSTGSMKLGTKHYCTQQQTLALINSSVTNDASITLAKALIAAKLNIAQGSELPPIISTINAAMNLIGGKRLPYDKPVSISSATGIQMLAYSATLNSYNSGYMNNSTCNGNLEKESIDVNYDQQSAGNLRIYPNPASSTTTLEFQLEESANVQLSLRDVTGRVMNEWNPGEVSGTFSQQIDVSNFSRGIYFVRLNVNGETSVMKLVVQ